MTLDTEITEELFDAIAPAIAAASLSISIRDHLKEVYEMIELLAEAFDSGLWSDTTQTRFTADMIKTLTEVRLAADKIEAVLPT